MEYIKKHIKGILLVIILLAVLVVALFFGGKEEPITEKETKAQETSKIENESESETTSSNGISVEEDNPWDDDGWSDIIYFD